MRLDSFALTFGGDACVFSTRGMDEVIFLLTFQKIPCLRGIKQCGVLEKKGAHGASKDQMNQTQI